MRNGLVICVTCVGSDYSKAVSGDFGRNNKDLSSDHPGGTSALYLQLEQVAGVVAVVIVVLVVMLCTSSWSR
jgi:hypothetical protein